MMSHRIRNLYMLDHLHFIYSWSFLHCIDVSKINFFARHDLVFAFSIYVCVCVHVWSCFVLKFCFLFVCIASHNPDSVYFIVRQYIHGKLTSSWKAFGIPLVSRLCNSSSGSHIRSLYLKLLSPFEIPAKDALEDFDSSEGTALEGVTRSEDTLTPDIGGFVKPCDENGANSPADAELQFYLADDKGTIKESKIEMNEPVGVKGVSRRLNVLVCWPEKGIQQYDTCLLSSLPEVFKSGIFSRRPQESVSLYKCLEAFLKEEPLGPEDMWSVCTS